MPRIWVDRTWLRGVLEKNRARWEIRCRTLPVLPWALSSPAPRTVHDRITSTVQKSRDVDTPPVGPAALGNPLRQTSASLPESPVENHLGQGIRGQLGDDGTVEVDLVARDDDKASTTVPAWAPVQAHALRIIASEARAGGCF
jgi:hypothetical protein